MIQQINGYALLSPFSNKDAGFSRWTTGKKNGTIYFIKEFLNPVFPIDSNVSPNIQTSMKKECARFVTNRTQIYTALNNASDGNLIRINEFFRVGSHFYIVTNNVPDKKYSLEEIAQLPYDKKLLLCRCLSHTISKIASNNIVHGDLKLTNILFHKTSGGAIVGKIIDFDGAFFEKTPPENPDDVDCDQVYIAPETLMFICGDDVKLTCKIDVFALGIIFHQIFSGELPIYDSSKYSFLSEALLGGDTIKMSPKVPELLKYLIERMLDVDPKKRISIHDTYNELGEMMGIHTASSTSRSASNPSVLTTNEKNTDKLTKSDNPMNNSYFHKAGSL